jgi:trans-aconitate methyltransferase
VRWLEADVRDYVPHRPVDLWHDRAVFHFLISPEDRNRYRDVLVSAVPVGGHALLATFAPDGPEQCSGLPVVRYDADALAALFAPRFAPVDDAREMHVTPRGKTQAFTWLLMRRVE